MRLIGTQAHGVRLPIISNGDNLPEIVADSLARAEQSGQITLRSGDIVGVTEAIVAKAQGNFATIEELASDVRQKFPSGDIGLVFPILSRNRFLNILKGIAKGADKVYVLLKYPSDEVGNPIMDADRYDELCETLSAGPIPAAEFKKLTDDFVHPFTGVDYIALYEAAGSNIEIFLSHDPRDILHFTKNVIVGEIHSRFRTKSKLEKAGAEKVYTLSDLLAQPVSGSGYNENYGVLGSNIMSQDTLKLFPRDCDAFVSDVRARILEKIGVAPEVLVYGDGAFKDPACGIWELADPVVSPAYTERLGGRPDEIKLKYVAENNFAGMTSEDKQRAITDMLRDKRNKENRYNDGTTPRKYADLLGSLCDLMSGSGDKGTPVVLIQGYFDDYSTE